MCKVLPVPSSTTPQSEVYNARVNDLLKLRDRRDAATGAMKKQLGKELADAQRIFVKEVKMYIRKHEKQGGKRSLRPQRFLGCSCLLRNNKHAPSRASRISYVPSAGSLHMVLGTMSLLPLFLQLVARPRQALLTQLPRRPPLT